MIVAILWSPDQRWRWGVGSRMAAKDKIFPLIEESPTYSISFPSGSLALSILSDLEFDMGLRCPNCLLGVQLNTIQTY